MSDTQHGAGTRPGVQVGGASIPAPYEQTYGLAYAADVHVGVTVQQGTQTPINIPPSGEGLPATLELLKTGLETVLRLAIRWAENNEDEELATALEAILAEVDAAPAGSSLPGTLLIAGLTSSTTTRATLLSAGIPTFLGSGTLESGIYDAQLPFSISGKLPEGSTLAAQVNGAETTTSSPGTLRLVFTQSADPDEDGTPTSITLWLLADYTATRG